MIEPAIYTQLNVSSITTYTSARIFPTDPAENTSYPFVVYTVGSAQPLLGMTSPTSLTRYDLTISYTADSLADITNLGEAIMGQLSGFRGGNIQGCFLTDQSNEAINSADEGEQYHQEQTYEVWASPLSAVASNTSYARTTTGFTFLLAQSSPLVVANDVANELPSATNGNIVEIMATAGSPPVGSSIIIDILVNGVSIWSVNPGNRISISASQTTGSQTAIDNPAIEIGDILTVNVVQVGSSFAGQNITIVGVVE